MHGKAILIVDDDENDRFFLHRALEARGLKNISQATNGKEAIDLLSQCEAGAIALLPWLMVLDLKMPYRDGFDVLKWLRARTRWKTFPVIVLTSSEEPGDIKRAHELGCNAYVVKPSDPAETMFLAGCIREFWMRYHRWLEA